MKTAIEVWALEIAKEALALKANWYIRRLYDIPAGITRAMVEVERAIMESLDPRRDHGLFLVILQDKDRATEPDVGIAFHLGAREHAVTIGRGMEEEMRIAGRCRCVHRVVEAKTSFGYRLRALMRPEII